MISAPDLSRTAGLLLAGGRSSRFGSDKALAPLRGQLLIERASRPLRRLPVWAISCKPVGAVADYAAAHGVVMVADGEGAPHGPLSGILAGLRWAQAQGRDWLASVPCDAPLLPDDLVPALLEHRGHARAAYAQTSAGPHPLCAVWSIELAGDLAERLDRGEHPSVRDFLTRAGAAAIRFDADEAFVNANTRDVLTDLEQRL